MINNTYYNITYNGSLVVHKICRMLRKSNYYKLAARYMEFNIISLNHNLIISTGKYLLWRVKNFVECAKANADSKDYEKSLEIINKGIERVELLKTIEEQDPPLLDADQQIIDEAFRILRQMQIKYELQSGQLTAEAWKKKIEDTYQNGYHRSLCAIESLSTEDTENYISIEKKNKVTPWKKDALLQAIEMINPDIEKVKEALIQVHEHKKRAKDQAGATFKSENPEAEVDEMLETHKKFNEDMIKETEWKESSLNAPLEIHIQLIIFAYETENRELFEDLLKSALIRLKFRRYEVPYVATVDILMSTSKDANIPNSFEKLPKDLNHANIKAELEKLRKADKKKDKDEEEEKKEPIKGKDKKNKAKEKEKAEISDDDEEAEKIDATPEELEKIKHIFINLLIQKSKNPKNAIVGIDVALIDESIEYDIPENHYAVAVPIRQHEGVYEQSNTIPYIVFKRTANFLRDEEDLLSLVTDVVVITGKSPNILPPLGYKKIPVDLRQTPHELERAPDIDCVFLCYKTDKDINIYERDLLTLKKLSDLSHSLIPLKDPKYEELPVAHKNLGLLYDFELLTDITKNVKDSLLGPVGTFYSREKHDQLDCLARILLNSFVLPIRRKMEQFFELKNQGELVEAERIEFKEILLRIHQILAKNTQTKKELTLVYLISSIFLSNICEEEGDFRSSIRIMRSALMRVAETREHRLKSDLQYSNNPTSEMHFHLHGYKILQTRKAKEERYKIWEGLILRNERERERNLNSQPPLDEDEADEEASEIERIEREKHALQDFIRKQRKEAAENQEEQPEEPQWEEKNYYKSYSTLDDLLNDLHIEILACLYRCEIKQGNTFREENLKTTKMLKIKGIKAPDEATAGLSTTLKKKFTMKKTKSIAEATNRFKQLEVTLQEAGQLPVTRPPPANFEKMIISENSHNIYQSAIFSMQVAASKPNKVEQKSLLLESLDFLKKASEDEEKLRKIIIDNSAAIKIGEHLMNFEDRGEEVYQKEPLSLMDKQRYLKKTVEPPKPIFMARTSTTITMKLPYFRPQTDHKEWRNISKMAIFGKESGSGVAVSLNNTEFPGTGDKAAPGSIITISNLTPNRKYVFA